jgi:DNA (cytosine-5)-methyltransferase 1
MRQLTCVSLFSGGMGLDLGLEQAGFSIKFASDNVPAAVDTARANRPDLNVLQADVRDLTADTILRSGSIAPESLDLVAGGPPCQSFSTAGRRMGLDDPDRGALVFEFVRLLTELRPKGFIMENVKGLLSASVKWRRLPYNNNGRIIDELHGSLFRELCARLEEVGYTVGFKQINAADYGVPQTRVRVFIVGYRDSVPVTFPRPTHAREAALLMPQWRTIRDALSGLRDDDSYCASFSARKLRYLRMIPPGGNWRDLPDEVQRESMGRAYFAKGGRSGYWRRLALDAPAPTILTEPQNSSTALCHPVHDRPLSVRECARIQTFPDEWRFAGRGPEQYKLVGNAVPVALARTMGAHIADTLREHSAHTAVA